MFIMVTQENEAAVLPVIAAVVAATPAMADEYHIGSIPGSRFIVFARRGCGMRITSKGLRYAARFTAEKQDPARLPSGRRRRRPERLRHTTVRYKDARRLAANESAIVGNRTD
jgi:hypothetical protein